MVLKGVGEVMRAVTLKYIHSEIYYYNILLISTY